PGRADDGRGRSHQRRHAAAPDRHRAAGRARGRHLRVVAEPMRRLRHTLERRPLRRSFPPSSPRAERRFVLLAGLLLAVLMTSVILPYARHGIVAADTNLVNLRMQAAEQAAGDGFVWAKQKLLAAPGSTSATLSVDADAGVTVSVGNGSGKRAITV